MKPCSARNWCGEKEKAVMNVGVGYETADYKYFVTLCRGFLKFGEEKRFEWVATNKIVFLGTGAGPKCTTVIANS
jgi:hypothetical protein